MVIFILPGMIEGTSIKIIVTEGMVEVAMTTERKDPETIEANIKSSTSQVVTMKCTTKVEYLLELVIAWSQYNILC